MNTEAFYDETTGTLTYLVWDPATSDAVVIDPVLDFDPESGVVSQQSYQKVADRIRSLSLNLRLVLETHAHADHLSASQLFKRDFPGTGVAIGREITQVQEAFRPVFELGEAWPADGSQFDQLITPYESFSAGSITIQPLPTPGHTPACLSYVIGDAVYTGDALFMPDFGTGRCDFPKGSATDLYRSVTGVLYKLPDITRVFVGHDYRPGGRPLKYESTIGEQKATNKQLHSGVSEQEFVAFRRDRDAGLSTPRLLYPSIQVNIEAGRLPESDSGSRFIRIPVTDKTGS